MTQNPKKPHLQSDSVFTKIENAHLAVESAKKMVAAATMSLDDHAFDHAKQAIEQAKEAIARAKTNKDDPLLLQCEKELADAHHQLFETINHM
ncbi:hypothetical protein NP92_08905 [Anoxybacillus gonensis]|uniref:DUF2564 family protein n=1 Tax=Anoxybacillus gonensis TaxID=198467 RepID=A0AAW7TEA2_9BACL|nr:DUF2564 family protein [Anoxybacillus gonensis]GIW50364.1 MAG: hypothetical protein KatS3mg080_0975 [Anoxybacillus sp.]AKS38297.1 hypothetical protein AFK25_06965 [Anoxybacillus gonensis]EMI10961.1 hypothetical protein F510_0692 [Anoxybacillus gonensis]KGP60531.1 hypothetical protein NP92_08905 [Anoxybacillus gonensis]MCQ5365524.1 DUF2564 family protein [Anoxybacillus gonensis]